jgi:hypothetical protein
VRLTRIVSGGQTGADRGGLDAAIELGIEHGGWCPRGRRAEDGVIPDRYQLSETDSVNYAVRTARNVVDSDGTLIVTRGEPAGGTALTIEVAAQRNVPHLVIDLAACLPGVAAAQLRQWLDEHGIATLNVAGPRASKLPTIHEETRALLVAALTGVAP